MATSGWYNDSDYSDLTLKLSDDREIKVHKMVICKNNEPFRRLCGKDSKFAESSQKTILLKEDDADALEEVLRKIYGCTLQPADKRSWQYWSKLVVTADKYLEPQLSKEAQKRFRGVAQLQTDGDVIFDIINVIKSDMSHIRGTAKLAESLRKNKLDKLLDNERYRALLDADKGLLWSHLDEIKGAAALVKKQHYLCPHHTDLIFKDSEPPGSKPISEKCPVCPSTYNRTKRESQHLWTPK